MAKYVATVRRTMSGFTVGLQWLYSGSTMVEERTKDGANRTNR
ncbi:hypothetical protein [Capnocytophaga ochracea]|nr:hypothetical protein [Capnocytophaga ochracea]